MIASIIIITVLSALAATFITLYFNQKELEKFDKKVDELSGNITDFKFKMANMQDSVKRQTLLTTSTLVEFLKHEKSSNVKTDGTNVSFAIGDDVYYIGGEHLPKMLYLRKGYDMKDAEGFHWDLFNRAAYEVEQGINMLKIDVNEGSSCGFYVICMDRTVEAFRENVETYLSEIDEGEIRTWRRYHELVEQYYPEEKESKEKKNQAQDLALKMAQAGGEHSKIKS